jgi:Mn-dependent DtxR family transcriptional regulator
MSNWTLFSNHGHVLICLSRDSEARLRDVAADVGITERAVQKIVRDLQDAGMVSVTKKGRRNSYRIHHKRSLRHDLEATCTLKDLIKVVNKAGRAKHPLSRGPTKAEKRSAIKPGRQADAGKPAPSPVVSEKPVKTRVAELERTETPSDRGQKANSPRPDKKDKLQGTLF